MTQELPDTKYLDEAARAADGWFASWNNVEPRADWSTNPIRAAIIAHARTLARLAELEAENAWRPIEEAPKDQATQILVPLGRSGLVDVVSWWDGAWREGTNGLRLACEPQVFRPILSPPKGGGA